MSDISKYNDAVEVIKTAILQSQYNAVRSVNEKQRMLYLWHCDVYKELIKLQEK